MDNQSAKNIGNQFGNYNEQNFQTNINFGDFVNSEMEKFLSIKKTLIDLDFDKQHQSYSARCQTNKGVFFIEGELEFGHSLVTKYLLFSHFFDGYEEKEIHFITNSLSHPSITVTTCEKLSISDNNIASVLELVYDWLKIKKVALIFENFPPVDFFNEICQPFMNFFEEKDDPYLKQLHVFSVNSAFLNQPIEIFGDSQISQLGEFDFVKIPCLERITLSQVTEWYNRNRRNLTRYNPDWLNNLSTQDEEVFKKETEEKPNRIIRKIIDSFELNYQNFINQI